MPIAFITGAGRGIGLETARQLAKRGYTVLCGVRTHTPELDELIADYKATNGVQAIDLNISEPESVKSAAKKVADQFGYLDVLINNAAVFNLPGHAQASEVAIEVVRETFEINFFSQVVVSQAFLPLLKKSAAPRVVNLSSSLGSLAEHAKRVGSGPASAYFAYDATKAAINMLTVNLAAELAPFGGKVNSADPGWVRTRMGGPSATRSIEEGAETPVYLATLGADGPSGGFFSNGLAPKEW